MEQARFRLTGYGRFDATRRVGPACWAWFDLLWVHAGRLRVRVMNRPAQTLGRGEGLLIYPNTPFEGDATTRGVRASVQHFELVGPRLPAPLQRLRPLRRGAERCAAADAEAFDELIDRAMELALLPANELVQSLREAQLTLLLGQLELDRQRAPSPGPRHDELGRLLDALRAHPERPWSLAAMAGEMGLSVSHFRALFRRRLGVSPGRYQQQARMREAARLLRDTGEPIKRIAHRLGFSDLPHFHRQFKAEYSLTPHRYRAQQSPRA